MFCIHSDENESTSEMLPAIYISFYINNECYRL